MRHVLATAIVASLGLSACGPSAPKGETNKIKVTSSEQQQLHGFAAYDLAIALKRAIIDAGYSCSRVTDAGFVATYQNLDMWMARCAYDNGTKREWAVFSGPDGSAQVRDCKDVPGSGLPGCTIAKRPAGKFDQPG